jgi:hypothetical protein
MGIYVRKVKQGNRVYHYLVTSYREGGKVKQKKLKYLGAHPTDEEIMKAKINVNNLLNTKKIKRAKPKK